MGLVCLGLYDEPPGIVFLKLFSIQTSMLPEPKIPLSPLASALKHFGVSKNQGTSRTVFRHTYRDAGFWKPRYGAVYHPSEEASSTHATDGRCNRHPSSVRIFTAKIARQGELEFLACFDLA